MPDDHFLRENPNPIPTDALKTPDFDVREYRTDEDINDIARSLEKKGQVMPILIGQQQDEQYPVLDGNHRVLAAKRLDWPAVDCIQTKSGVDEDQAQIIANISRLELSPSEKLSTFDYMLNVLDMTQSAAADEVGLERVQVNKYANILKGYGEIKEFFVQGELGVNACWELNKMDDRDRAVDIAQTAVREGYVDADVVQQAKYARGEEEAEDEMRGAGSKQNTQNLQQVKRNAEAMGELDPIDQQGVQDAQVASPEGQAASEGEGQGQPQQQPQGPPCEACGAPMTAGGMLQVQVHPELAQELGVSELTFGAQCTGKFIEWWSQRQEQASVDGEPVEAEE